MTLLWNRISIISIPMLVIGLRQCDFHAFNEESIRGGNSWIPKKASNAFEAFEVVFMELWTWTRCLLLCHKSVIWLRIWVREIFGRAVKKYQSWVLENIWWWPSENCRNFYVISLRSAPLRFPFPLCDPPSPPPPRVRCVFLLVLHASRIPGGTQYAYLAYLCDVLNLPADLVR